jgi:putative membrane protein insertion efficiency factor
VKYIILGILRFYKRYISPLCPPACRFVPTCSEYAMEAFEKKPLFTAIRMTVVRIAKCHPFHPGGHDPVK